MDGAGGLALERPVSFRSDDAGRELEALAAVPAHLVDHPLGTDVVADQVLVAREEGDGYLLQQVRHESDGRLAVLSTEMTGHRSTALLPPSLLVRVDVEGGYDVLATEVRSDLLQIRRPVHATRRVVAQADVVHVDALLHSIGFCVFCHLQNGSHDSLADGRIDTIHAAIVESLYTFTLLMLDLLCTLTSCRDQAALVGIWEVSEVLIHRRDPAVTNEQALERPRSSASLLVALENCAGNVRDVLACV